MPPPSDSLDLSTLRLVCTKHIIGNRIDWVNEVTSTNDIALQWGEEGEREGAVIFAEFQTAGRGQFGRRWHSPPGSGIWCSILLRPAISPSAATCLTPLAVMAVASALQQSTGLQPLLKPPNDLFYAGGKVSGILTEARTGHHFFAVVGIGINVNQKEFPPELQGIATSLRKEIGYCCNRTQVALNVLLELNRLYLFLSGRMEEIQTLYDSWPQMNQQFPR